MKHTISRRTLLRGLGVTMALPWMESMRPLLAFTQMAIGCDKCAVLWIGGIHGTQ